MRHAGYPRLEYTVEKIGSLSPRQILAIEQSLLVHSNPLLRRVSILPPPTIIQAPPAAEFTLTMGSTSKNAVRKPGKPKKTNGKRRLHLH